MPDSGALLLPQVGSQFVQQYYTVLSNTPRYLHRFYTDISTMSHNDVETGVFFTVASQKVFSLSAPHFTSTEAQRKPAGVP